MRRTRALRTLNVNPDTKQTSLDSKTSDAAFSSTQNDFTGIKCQLEQNSKNTQLLKENKLMKQLKQKAQVMEQQAASSSRSLESPESSEFSTVNRTEEPDDDYFPPTGLLYSSDIPSSSGTTAPVACEVSGALASSSNNIVADLHEKLCNSHAQNKKNKSRKRSLSADTDDGLPLLNTVVNDILSLEADFPLPSTSFADVSDMPTAEFRKRFRKKYTRAAPRRKRNQRKASENVASVSSIPSTSINDAAAVISDNDSDCEIMAYVPSNSQQIDASSEVRSNVTLESVEQHFSLSSFPFPRRLDSIINMLHDSVQRFDDDDVIVIDTIPQANSEDKTNWNRSVVEIGSTSGEGQLTPPVIVVSEDESEPAVKPALNEQLKTTRTDASSREERRWECPICWEKLTQARGVYSTMCGHVYCSPCITHVLKTTKKCPMCRKSVTKKKVHPLFLDE